MKKTVAVVIPAYRPGPMLREILRRLAEQTQVPEEVRIIESVDDSGRPDTLKERLTAEFGEHFARFGVSRVRKDEFGHGRTRDLGLRQTDSGLVLCMTQDALPADRNLVSVLARAFSDPLTGAAYARQLAGKKSSPLEREARAFNYPAESCVKTGDDLQRLGIKTFFCSDVCAMWNRDVYEKLGGFEKDVIFNEDMILAGKMIFAGYRIAYCADARVWHSHNYSAGKQFHRNFDLGVSQTDHPEIFGRVSSGREGVRFVRTAASDLLRRGEGYLLPELVWQSGCKFLGYQLGRRYRSLPAAVVRRFSDSPKWWDKDEKMREASTHSTQ